MALIRRMATVHSSRTKLIGTWYLRASGRVLFCVTVRHGKQGLEGTWWHPVDFQFNGTSFTGVSGDFVAETANRTRENDGGLELVFDDPDSEDPPFVIILNALDSDEAEMSFPGTNFRCLPLTRSLRGQPVRTWDQGRSYDIAFAHPTNPLMTETFSADQDDNRQTSTRLDVLHATNAKHRERTQQMLNDGELSSGTDFLHAAFVFQHGDSERNYLMAHLLSLAALARGRNDALWLAAATLDRYLLSIGRSQVFGTQRLDASGTVVEPFDEALVTGALHDVFHFLF